MQSIAYVKFKWFIRGQLTNCNCGLVSPWTYYLEWRDIRDISS